MIIGQSRTKLKYQVIALSSLSAPHPDTGAEVRGNESVGEKARKKVVDNSVTRDIK